MLEPDETHAKIEQFYSKIGASTFKDDTALAIAMIKENKEAIHNHVYEHKRRNKLVNAMYLVLSSFPNSDKHAIEKALGRIGIPTKTRDLLVLRISITVIYLILASLILANVTNTWNAIWFIVLPSSMLFYCVYKILQIHLDLAND